MPQKLASAVKQIVDLQPDLFVLSGDLIDFPPDKMDDPHFHELAADDYRLILRALKPVSCRSLIVYGNHDHPDVFREIVQPYTDIIVEDMRAIAFLDDEHEHHVPYRIGKERERFEAALQKSSQSQIHVQHYMVWPERNENYPHTYGDGRAMREKLISSGSVRLVLSGHYHEGVPPFIDKGVWFSTVRAFGEAPYPYMVYDLDGSELTWQEYLVSDEGHG